MYFFFQIVKKSCFSRNVEFNKNKTNELFSANLTFYDVYILKNNMITNQGPILQQFYALISALSSVKLMELGV